MTVRSSRPPDGVPKELDLPHVGDRRVSGHLEAYWAYGFDPRTRIGWYVYLAADDDTGERRRESVYLLLPDGSVLARSGAGTGSRCDTAVGDGVSFRCDTPFTAWTVQVVGDLDRIEAAAIDTGRVSATSVVNLSLKLAAATPAWDAERTEGGDPWPAFRHHQLMHGTGQLVVDGEAVDLSGSCFRSHSLRRRVHEDFHGHLITNVLLPSGRAVGVLSYRDADGESDRGRGFVFDGERLHHAELIEASFLAELGGATVRHVLRSDLGRTEVDGHVAARCWSTVVPGTHGVGNAGASRRWGAHLDEVAGIVFEVAFVRYTVDGEVAVGPMERSARAPWLTSRKRGTHDEGAGA